MTAYTELKRLAEDCKNYGIDFDDVSPQQGSTSCDKLVRHYIAEVLPDTLLSMIDALDVQAGSIEAVQAANQRLAAERDKLRTQNQALREALKDLKRQYSEHPDAFWDWSKARAALALAEGGV